MLQGFGNKAASPFIEVANDQPRVLELGRQQDLPAHQQTCLLAALHISRAQMNVEEMHDLARSDFQIAADTATGFTARRGEVVNADFTHGKSEIGRASCKGKSV